MSTGGYSLVGFELPILREICHNVLAKRVETPSSGANVGRVTRRMRDAPKANPIREQ